MLPDLRKHPTSVNDNVVNEQKNEQNESIAPPSPAEVEVPPEVVGAVIDELHRRTKKAVPPEWAIKVARQILGGYKARHPASHVRRSIRDDPNPARFLPTPTP